MSHARLVLRNMKQFRMEMLKADNKRRKAGETAVKVEMFRRMKKPYELPNLYIKLFGCTPKP